MVDETAWISKLATAAVVKSAFGFQGQKCSAASRVIVIAEVYSHLLGDAGGSNRRSPGGPAEENYAVGAVISQNRYQMILAEIGQGKAQARLLGRRLGRGPGWRLLHRADALRRGPRRFPASRQHQIFGPVLSVIRARDFDDAVDLFNRTEYGTHRRAFQPCSRQRIEVAEHQFYVGNLYINREITGARVGLQPFGGFKMSGTNAKAGGPDYVRLFLEMKTVAERI